MMAETFPHLDSVERINQERAILQQKLAQIREKVSSHHNQHVWEEAGNSNASQGETTVSEAEDTTKGGLMTSKHRQILTRNRATLVENMVPTDLFRHLVAKDTLTSAEERRIRAPKTWEDINCKLLDVIVTRSDSAFTFLEQALRDTCQEHLADLMLDEEGKREHVEDVMSPENKQAIHRNRDRLATDITPDEVFNDMISEKILSTSEVSRIKEKGTREETNEYLLDYIVRRSDRGFGVFVESLKNTGQEHLAALLTSQSQRLEQKRKKLKSLNIPANGLSPDNSPTHSISTPHVVQTSTFNSSTSQRSDSVLHKTTITRSKPSSLTSQTISANQNSSHKSNISSAFHETQMVENIHVPSSQSLTASAHTSSSTFSPESCTLDDVKQQIMFMAENAYANIRRKDNSVEAFSQFSKEMSQTTESINDSLQVFTMIKEFCEETHIDGEGQGQGEESSSCHDNQSVPDVL